MPESKLPLSFLFVVGLLLQSTDGQQAESVPEERPLIDLLLSSPPRLANGTTPNGRSSNLAGVNNAKYLDFLIRSLPNVPPTAQQNHQREEQGTGSTAQQTLSLGEVKSQSHAPVSFDRAQIRGVSGYVRPTIKDLRRLPYLNSRKNRRYQQIHNTRGIQTDDIGLILSFHTDLDNRIVRRAGLSDAQTQTNTTLEVVPSDPVQRSDEELSNEENDSKHADDTDEKGKTNQGEHGPVLEAEINRRGKLIIHESQQNDHPAEHKFLAGALRFGLPSSDNLKLCENFVLSYDRRLKHPIWVLQHLTPERVRGNEPVDGGLSSFYSNETLHEYFRSTNDDYLGSGYDRCHMSPACDDMADRRWMDQSFCLTNIAPQLPGLYRGPWRLLEKYVDHLARRSRNMYIVTGTAYQPMEKAQTITYRLIGENRVSVPTHFYKVWVREDVRGKLSMEGFLLPNIREIKENFLLAPFRIDIDKDLSSIERSTGLIFFDKLDRSKAEKPVSFQERFIDKVRSLKEKSEGSPEASTSKDSLKSKLVYDQEALDQESPTAVSEQGSNIIEQPTQSSLELSRSTSVSAEENRVITDLGEQVAREIDRPVCITIYPEVDPNASIEKVYDYLFAASRFGIPNSNDLKLCENFVLSYDRRLKHPVWMLEVFDSDRLPTSFANRRLFQLNQTRPCYFPTIIEDNVGKKASTSHANSLADQHQVRGNTYCLSTFAPQLMSVRKGPWAMLENHIFQLARRSKNLYVITGTVYLPDKKNRVVYQMIGNNKVNVPTHFYKVLVSESQHGDLSMEAYEVPNSQSASRAKSLGPFRVDVDKDLPKLERFCGLKFFEKLDRRGVAKPKR